MHALALYLCNIASEEDQEKLICLYNTYLDIMMYTARKYVGQYQAEEDVVHNAILKSLAWITRRRQTAKHLRTDGNGMITFHQLFNLRDKIVAAIPTAVLPSETCRNEDLFFHISTDLYNSFKISS